MKNIDVLNICYMFFNRFITANVLIEKLSSIDKSKLSRYDIDKTNTMINDIKKIEESVPNTVDEYVTKRKEHISNIIKKLEQFPKDEKSIEYFNKQLENLKKDYESEMDSHERWFAIFSYIGKSSYFKELFESLSDFELLEFLARYIQAPLPPKLSQEDFDNLVKAGIEKDKREWLWRLAFNYEKSDINLNEIAKYFVNIKDAYYLCELISAVGKRLDIDSIIDMIDDVDFIKDIVSRKSIIKNNISDEQLNRLIELKEIK